EQTRMELHARPERRIRIIELPGDHEVRVTKPMEWQELRKEVGEDSRYQQPGHQPSGSPPRHRGRRGGRLLRPGGRHHSTPTVLTRELGDLGWNRARLSRSDLCARSKNGTAADGWNSARAPRLNSRLPESDRGI